MMMFYRAVCLFCFFTSLSASAFAASSENHIELGIYTSSITYTEPSVMEEKGSLFGVIGRIASHNNGDFSALEASYSSGDMDYQGSGTIKGIPDTIFEIRGLIGGDLALGANYRMTPYMGLGYRNLNDDSSGMVSSTSAHGYEREQIYLYIPLGLEFKRADLVGGWALGGRIEYDYLLKGKNNSYASVVPGNDDLSFTQSEGRGNRISVSFTRTFSSKMSVIIEPFYKYWNISESTVEYDSMNRAWVEPYNYSKEMGIALLLTL